MYAKDKTKSKSGDGGGGGDLCKVPVVSAA